MAISITTVYKINIHQEVQMTTQTTTQLIQWQDFKVMSEVDLVLKMAQQNRWKDCKIFGFGSMITQPLESNGWKLVPADLYEYSIPAEGVDRILQIVNAGVRIQGVIIADDKRGKNPSHTHKKSMVSLPSERIVYSLIGRGLLGLVILACVVLIGLTAVAGAIILAPMILLGTALGYDPKLIILVDDGNGGTVWVSVLTWYD
jgi:hypothetical protein